MRSSFFRTSQALRYVPVDARLATDRLAALSLRPLAEPAAQPAKDDDLPALRDALTFLKFDELDIKKWTAAVQSTLKIVGGIVSVVGAVTSVVDLMKTLGVFGTQDDATQLALQQIGVRVNQIYEYLKQKERKGLYLQAGGWRWACARARNALRDARLSPTPDIINDLVKATTELDGALDAMLDPNNAKIAFLRGVYKYTDSVSHWIDAAVPPFMTTTDGRPIPNYADSNEELQTEIWDPGHFIDVLFAALETRMLVMVTIEPAFRSTGYNREQLKRLATGLTAFIKAWQDSMLVASPAAGLSGGYPNLFGGPAIPAPGAGLLQNPYSPYAHYLGTESAPPGIVLGAVDPVIGIAVWEPYWDGFEIVSTVSLMDFGLFQEAWGGGYDTTRAKDLTKALAAATQRQAQLLDQVVSASSIGALIQLRGQLELAASEVTGSEFVQLPNARFRLVKTGIHFDGSPVFAIRQAGVESIDLGRLSRFAQDPEKKHEGTRYFQETLKTFRFRMARRARRTRIQLGYRLRIGDTDIPLALFSIGDDGTTPFSAETIAVEVRESAFVYDVRQSHVFSFAEEDLFEAGEPLRVTRWSTGWRGRLFLDERLGKVALAVEVRFEHDPTGRDYACEAIVTIRNLDPERFPDATILPVQVFETHIAGDDDQPKEYLADSMTVHVVPSFLVMKPDYFGAYWAAWAVALKTNARLQLDDPFSRSGLQELLPRRPFPDPAWAVRRRVAETAAVIDAIDVIRVRRPEAVAEVIQELRSPAVQTATLIASPTTHS